MKKDISSDSTVYSAYMEEQPVYTLMSDAVRYLDERVVKKTRNQRLQAGARRVLAYLAIGDGVSQLELIRATRLKAPTISLIVQKMEQDGLITRKTDDIDMRLTRVYLTDRGRALNTEILSEIHEAEEAAMADFTDEERLAIRSFLLRIHRNLEASDPKNS